ncbi:BTAD domain-containing putative transcriptional regulator [Chloroflexus sp.]|uniref:BTAD domain-containing putative transcriptional regulator n=1 Tax=Chloroflexus sp. TaxID=1904827 RepID=UPI002ADDB615|nr:BTAD domain-containing putative transcriptional regulator [Chloroflexus sp.]
MSTRWYLQLLGGFDVRRNDISISSEFQTDSARLLFAWLCFHQRQLIRREMLAGLFWPDRSQTAAQNTLRVTLSRIRHALADASFGLTTTAQTVTLRLPTDWEVDALHFEQLVTAIRSHIHRSPLGCRHCQELLQTASALYRGEFLAGITPESEFVLEWSTRQQEYFHRAVLEVLTHLTEYALRMQDWHTALEYANRQLQMEPWREEAHRHVMLALAYQGQRVAALAQYQRCCDILQQEFAIEPDLTTQALAATIQNGHRSNTDGTLLAQRRAVALDQLPLVGRDEEIRTLTDLINRPDLQLISIVGVGGTGKTRLAIRAAQLMRFAFRDGVRYIFLHPEDDSATAGISQVTDPAAHVARMIADACQIEVNDRQSPESQVIAALHKRAYLLVFDSFEQVVAANRFLHELLEAAPECVALITSRQRLYIRGEYVISLGPLSLATVGHQQSASAQMFVTLAERYGLVFDAVALQRIEQICTALSGLPLGIELAVACLSSMNLETLQQAVQHSLRVLNNPLVDVPDRHRSLYVVFESVWQSLCEARRRVLAMLSVVCAPCPLPAALAITEDRQLLRELMDRALIHLLHDDTVWIHDYIRQFAREKLTHVFAHLQLEKQALRRHAAWFLAWLAALHPHLRRGDSASVRERLTASYADLDIAWYWALAHGEWEWVSAAVAAFEDLYRLTGRFVDGIRRFQQSIAYVSQANQPAAQILRVRLICGLVSLQRVRSGYREVETMLAEALMLSSQLADTLLQAMSLSLIGSQRCIAGDHDRGRDYLLRALGQLSALSEQTDNIEVFQIKGNCMRSLCELNVRLGNISEAEQWAQQALAVAQYSNDHLAIARCFEALSNIATACGHLAESEQYLCQALDIYQRLNISYQKTNVLDLLAQNADARGDYELAQQYYFQALALAYESGNRDAEMIAHINLGISYDLLGDYGQALTHTQIALSLCNLVGDHRHYTTIMANLSLHAHHDQRHELALIYAQTTIEQAQRSKLVELVGYGYDFQGHALLALNRIDEAEQAYQEALRVRRQLKNQVLIFETQAGLTRVALARHNAVEALQWALPIVEYLLAGGRLDGAEETLRIYWTVYQALLAHADSRATTVLELGYHLIQERARRLSDPHRQATYLNAEFNRYIIAAYYG